MSQNYSKSRQQAEIAFTNAQSQFFARNSVVDEIDLIEKERNDKTQRLRQARLEREQNNAAARAK